MQIQERSPEARRQRERKGGGTHVLELEEAELAEVGDGDARALGGDDELHVAHLLGPQVVHRRQAVEHPHPAPSLPPEPPSRSFQKVRGRGEDERAGAVVRLSDVRSEGARYSALSILVP